MPIMELQEQLYANGTIPFGPIVLPQGINGCELRIARCTTATPTLWPNALQRVTIALDCSYDGGATYQIGQFGFSQVGGIFMNKAGGEVSEDVVRFRCTPQIATHVRGLVTIAGGPIRTAVTFLTL